MGGRRIVDNRPDGEDPGQPSAGRMEEAGRAAGVDQVYAPGAGMPGPDGQFRPPLTRADGFSTAGAADGNGGAGRTRHRMA